jgi:hypothetical protein
MTKPTVLETTIILSLMLAATVTAQAAVSQPAICRLPIEALNDAGPPAPAANTFARGRETSTLPWSAPVGHHQPQATDVTSSAPSSIDQAVVEENARIDELIKGVCRGC